VARINREADLTTFAKATVVAPKLYAKAEGPPYM
jgi:hypothetical protein